MDQNSRLIQNSSSLNKYLISLLSNFDKNKDKDLIGWLSKVEQVLKDNPSPYINEKELFGKRLAQCLIPEFSEEIHQKALQIYELIFNNVKMVSKSTEDYCSVFCSDIGIYSVGIFPFYQFAAPKLKQYILKIIQEYYIPLKRQIIPCLPGLLMGLIPGLDDNVEEVVKDLFKTIDLIKNAAGRKYFIGCLWMVIARQQKGRASAIHLLSSILPKIINNDEDVPMLSDDDEEIERQKKRKKKKEDMIEKAKDEKIEKTKNLKLEFIECQIDANTDFNNFPNKTTLVLNAIICCLEDSNNLVRRNILDFMILHIKPQSALFSDPEKISLIQAVLYLLKTRDNTMIRRVNTWLFDKPDVENLYQLNEKNQVILELVIEVFKNIFKQEHKDLQSVEIPIKILQNFYNEHQNMVSIIISKMSVTMIEYFYKYHIGHPFSAEFQKLGLRFLNSPYQQIDQIIQGLLDNLQTCINMKEKNDEKCKEIILLIEYASQIQNEKEDSAFTSLLQILKGLFQIFGNLSKDQIINLSFLNIALTFIGKIIEKLEGFQIIKKNKNIALIKPNNNEQIPNGEAQEEGDDQPLTQIKFNKEIEPEEGQVQEDLRGQEISKNKTEVDLKLDQSIDFFTIFMSNILHILEQDQSQNRCRGILKQAVGVIISMQQLLEIKQLTKCPLWFESLLSCIKIDPISDYFFAIEYLIKLFSMNQPIYIKLRSLIIEKFTSNQEEGRLIIKRLWVLLDYRHDNYPTISLLIIFNDFFPNFLIQIIIDQFKDEEIYKKEIAIKRFALFFKNTYKNDSLNLKQIHQIGLQHILQFLDHENYILRHVSKNWLVQDNNIQKTIDPLFSKLIMTSDIFYLTQQGQYILLKNDKIFKMSITLDKFKNIMRVCNNVFVNYLSNTPLSEEIIAILPQLTTDKHSFLFNSNEELPPEQKKMMTYLDILILLCIKFLKVQALESISYALYIEGQAINSLSSDILEQLISSIEDQQISLAICGYIVNPLLEQLWNFAENNENSMQVQILGLIKVIFFHSSFSRRCNYHIKKQIFVPILSSSLFIKSIVAGLKTESVYIRGNFINFISTCVPLISNYLLHPFLTNWIKSVLHSYYKIIQLHENSYNDIQQGAIIILNFFFHIKKLEELERYMLQKSQASLSDTMASLITLGYYSSDGEKPKTEYLFDKHPETCECILQDIKQIIKLFIVPFSNSDQFLNICSFTDIGGPIYEYEKFKTYNEFLSQQIKSKNNKNKSLKIVKALFMQYPLDVMNAFLMIWNLECAKEIKSLDQEFLPSQLMKKIIELLISLNIHNEIFLESFYNSQIVYMISEFNIKKNKNDKKNVFYLSYENSQNESRILYFLYLYFSYNLFEQENIKRNNLENFWLHIFKLVNKFSLSKNPSTILWILELLFMLSSKYSPAELMNDKKFRNEYQEIISQKLMYCSHLISSAHTLVLNEQVNNIKDISQFQNKFKMIVPFSPLHYQLFLQYNNQRKLSKKKIYVKDQDSLLDIFGNIWSTDESEIQIKFRLISIKTMQHLTMFLLENSHSFDKKDKIHDNIKLIMEPLFGYIQTHPDQDSVFEEYISELAYTYLKTLPELSKDFKKQIFYIYNQERIFSIEKQILKYYSKIINLIIQNDKNTNYLNEYQQKLSLLGDSGSNFFSKELEENKKKLNSFKRFLFIIFVGDIDQYQEQLHTYIEKICEIFKNSESSHPSLLVLLLFSIRILILRLSSANIIKMFQELNPLIINVLIQILTNSTKSRQTFLQTSALKLLEIMSKIQIDIFSIHQWPFVYDYFGIKIQNCQGQGGSPFIFQPIVTQIFEKDAKIDYQTYSLIDRQKKLELKENERGESDLKQHSMFIVEQIILNNEVQVVKDFQIHEDQLLEDFINLNEQVLQF